MGRCHFPMTAFAPQQRSCGSEGTCGRVRGREYASQFSDGSRQMRVVLTGATGLIGGEIAGRLVGLGHEVLAEVSRETRPRPGGRWRRDPHSSSRASRSGSCCRRGSGRGRTGRRSPRRCRRRGPDRWVDEGAEAGELADDVRLVGQAAHALAPRGAAGGRSRSSGMPQCCSTKVMSGLSAASRAASAICAAKTCRSKDQP